MSVRQLPKFTEPSPVLLQSDDNLVSAQAVIGSLPATTPCLENRMFPQLWAEGINSFHEQSRGLVLALPVRFGSINPSNNAIALDASFNRGNGVYLGNVDLRFDSSLAPLVNSEYTGALSYAAFANLSTSEPTTDFTAVPSLAAVTDASLFQGTPPDISTYESGFTLSVWFYGPFRPPFDSGSQALGPYNLPVIASTYRYPGDVNPEIDGWTLGFSGDYSGTGFGDVAYINFIWNYTNDTAYFPFWIDYTLIGVEWIHVAIVVHYYATPDRGTNGMISMIQPYVNGIKMSNADSTPYNHGSDLAAGAGITIGGNPLDVDSGLADHVNHKQFSFHGAIQDFRIYNRPLTAGEVKDLYRVPDELYDPPTLLRYFSVENLVTGDGGVIIGGGAIVTSSSGGVIIGGDAGVFAVQGGVIIGGTATVTSTTTYLESMSGGIEIETFPSFSDVITRFNPYIWFRLNEYSGTTVTNSGLFGSLTDGVYHDDVFLKQHSLILEDIGNLAVCFGGVSSYISVATIGAINGTPISTRTVSLFFETGTDVITRQVLYEEGDVNRGFAIYMLSSTVVISVWNMTSDTYTTGWGMQFITSGPYIEPRHRYQVAFTFDAATKVLIGFLNGTIFGFSLNSVRSVGSHDAIKLGAKINGIRYFDGVSFGDGDRFVGYMDEVIVDGVYMTPYQIFLIYNSSFPPGYFTENFYPDSAGGTIVEGDATSAVKFNVSATGGVVLSGDADHSTYVTGSGGLVIGGSVIYTFESGGVIIGGEGDANFAPNYIEDASGGVVIGGNGSYAKVIVGEGGLIISGDGEYQSTLNIILPITWNINQEVVITLDLTWNLVQGKLRFYQVTSVCQDQTISPFADDTVSCQTTQVATFVASNIFELCEKLITSGYSGIINSVGLYNNPVFLSDFTTDNSVFNNYLTDVTSEITYTECASLLYRHIDSTIGATCIIEDNIYIPTFMENINIDEITALSGSTYGTGGLVIGSGIPGMGGMTMGGGATSYMVGFDSIVVGSMGSVYITQDPSVVYPFEDADATLEVDTELIITPCNPDGLPPVLKVEHNIDDIPYLDRFILRNNITIPSILDMSWNDNLGVWQVNLHYSGLSTTTSQTENINILMSFGCTTSNSIGDVTLKLWSFRLFINSTNSTTGTDKVLSMLAVFDITSFGSYAIQASTLDLNFIIDVINEVATPDANNIIVSDGGFFAGKNFSINPLLSFHVSGNIPEINQDSFTINI